MQTIKQLKENYELEIDRIINEIKKQKSKSVLLQFPDGLKQYSTQIVDEIEEKLGNKDVEIKIWLGSCFGACDVPNTKSDLIIQFGHANWNLEF